MGLGLGLVGVNASMSGGAKKKVSKSQREWGKVRLKIAFLFYTASKVAKKRYKTTKVENLTT